jgi:hypothetical protein
VKAKSFNNKDKGNIARALEYLIGIMGKPDIISADAEVIGAMYVGQYLDWMFAGITPYRTIPQELNENAIVEQMIRTLKEYILDILMEIKLEDLRYAAIEANVNLTDYLLNI